MLIEELLKEEGYADNRHPIIVKEKQQEENIRCVRYIIDILYILDVLEISSGHMTAIVHLVT